MKNEVKMDLQSQVEALLERPSDTAVEAFFGKVDACVTNDDMHACMHRYVTKTTENRD